MRTQVQRLELKTLKERIFNLGKCFLGLEFRISRFQYMVIVVQSDTFSGKLKAVFLW